MILVIIWQILMFGIVLSIVYQINRHFDKELQMHKAKTSGAYIKAVKEALELQKEMAMKHTNNSKVIS